MKTRKEKIIDCGRKLLVEKGYHGASINVIAEDVGLKKSSIYSHFSSKDEIVCEALQSTQLAIEDCVQLTGHYQADFQKTLEKIIEFLKHHKKCIGLGVLYDYDESIDEKVMIQIQQFFHAFKQTLLMPLLQQNGHDEPTLENMVEDIISLIEGATLWVVLSDNTQPLERIPHLAMIYLAQLNTRK